MPRETLAPTLTQQEKDSAQAFYGTFCELSERHRREAAEKDPENGEFARLNFPGAQAANLRPPYTNAPRSMSTT